MRIAISTGTSHLVLPFLLVLLLLLRLNHSCHAFSGISPANSKAIMFVQEQQQHTNVGEQPPQECNLKYDPTFVPPDCVKEGIYEELCIDTCQRMKRIFVPVPKTIHPNGEVGISYSYWSASSSSSSSSSSTTATTQEKSGLPPIILVHGFDSSNLEYRRLGSRLAQRGFDTYAVDLLGWGYTQLVVDDKNTNSDNENVVNNSNDSNNSDTIDFSANAKVVALQSFIEQVVGRENDFIIAGASLGGAAAIETAVKNSCSSLSSSSSCKGLILIDAQGFVDGVGIMSLLPKPIARLGVNVLQSIPLRSTANQMSYYNRTTYATDEAVTIGRVHTLRPGWNDALVNFMQSGGFTPSKYISQITVPTLILWGEQDTTLDGKKFVPQFMNTIPSTTSKTNLWIDECGHVPHLEQPDRTADAIYNFVVQQPTSKAP